MGNWIQDSAGVSNSRPAKDNLAFLLLSYLCSCQRTYTHTHTHTETHSAHLQRMPIRISFKGKYACKDFSGNVCEWHWQEHFFFLCRQIFGMFLKFILWRCTYRVTAIFLSTSITVPQWDKFFKRSSGSTIPMLILFTAFDIFLLPNCCFSFPFALPCFFSFCCLLSVWLHFSSVAFAFNLL